MFRQYGKRTINSAISIIGLVIVVFFMARLTGDPADLYLPDEATAQVRQEYAEIHGLNDPVIVQFVRFLSGITHLDFGDSLRLNRPALDLVLDAFPTTLLLAAITMCVSVPAALLIGALAARNPGGAFDRIASTLSLLGASAPQFWFAIVGILLLAVWLHLVPTSGFGGPIYWILPIIVMSLRPIGLIGQVVRGSMINALSSIYVKTAKAKGAGPARILFVHALRNAMLPVITVAGDQAAGMVNGAIIVETIFGFPGIGKLMIDAITFRDFAVLQAAVILTASAIFVLNFAIDFLYAVLDPRIRLAGR
jgi:peptide/nickel transport system permease protein